jgi:hypothetical protein
MIVSHPKSIDGCDPRRYRLLTICCDGDQWIKIDIGMFRDECFRDLDILDGITGEKSVRSPSGKLFFTKLASQYCHRRPIGCKSTKFSAIRHDSTISSNFKLFMCQPRLHAPVIPPGGKMCATNACGVGGLVGGDGPSSGWGTVDEQWCGWLQGD